MPKKINNSTIVSVQYLIDKMISNPARFRNAHGYDHLLKRLWRGESGDAMIGAALEYPQVTGDILGVICELADTSPFVELALKFVDYEDVGTSSYAHEIVVRGTDKNEDIRLIFKVLESSGRVLHESTAQALYVEGYRRIRHVVEALNNDTCTNAVLLLSNSPDRDVLRLLLYDESTTSQVVGAACGALWSEITNACTDVFADAPHAWIQEFGDWFDGLNNKKRERADPGSTPRQHRESLRFYGPLPR